MQKNRALAMSFMLTLCLVSRTWAGHIAFPADPRAVLDARRDCGAKGDGQADDTPALQTALERSGAENKIVYLPEGVYRVTRTLVFRKPNDKPEGSAIGPWVYGEERDKTIIKLDDHAQGFDDVSKPLELLRCMSRRDGARMNADFFDRTVVNLTIDTGHNAGAVGIKFYSNNTGLLRDVLIRGDGECGLSLGFCAQNGPLLVQDLEVQGFATGVSTSDSINAQTLSRITIGGARRVGLDHGGQSLAVEGLTVVDAPLAVRSGGNGVLTLIDADLRASQAGAAGPAIQVGSADLYVQRLRTHGFSDAIVTKTAREAGPTVEEYASGKPIRLDAQEPAHGLALSAPREPAIGFDDDPARWVCANDFGAKFGDDVDDAPAIQKAIDHAASIHASTVYLLPIHGGDPNWYWLKSDVHIHGSVSRIVGLGFARLLGGSTTDANYPRNLGRFMLDDDAIDAPPVVMIFGLQSFAPTASFGIETRTTRRTLVCLSTVGTIIAGPNTTVFATNCGGHAYQQAGSKLWLRQWNTERGPGRDQHGVNTRNDGGQLWIMGMKTEAKSTKVQTLSNGRTEVLGVLNYNNTGAKDATPYFEVKDATLSVGGYREVCFVNGWWNKTVVATLGSETFTQPMHEWQTWSLLRVGK